MPDPRRDWPALMDLRTAGEYLALRPSTVVRFLERQAVPAVDLGVRLRRWRKRDLDVLIARLPPYGAGDHAPSQEEGGGMDQAIEAVERRARRRRGNDCHEVRQSRPAS